MHALPRWLGVVASGLLTVALPACGQRGLGAGGSGGRAGTGAVAGAGGGAVAAEPPADISRRWGMFGFDDPVGVFLKEAADGTLTGQGCGLGPPDSKSVEIQPPPFSCANLSGKVTGHTAWFSFPIAIAPRPEGYAARVTISTDGSRMAGKFEASDFPTAWLRVPDDGYWPTPAKVPADDLLQGRYDLTLVPEATTGTEFTGRGTYLLTYAERRFWGDLGSFWSSEVSDPSLGTPLRVGPVPATEPGLPTSLTLDFDATGFVRVVARTPSGGLYTFLASKQ